MFLCAVHVTVCNSIVVPSLYLVDVFVCRGQLVLTSTVTCRCGYLYLSCYLHVCIVVHACVVFVCFRVLCNIILIMIYSA